MDFSKLVQKQRTYFETGKTLPISERLLALSHLQDAIVKQEGSLQNALHLDLNKSAAESYMTEIAMVLAEIRYTIRHLKRWAKARATLPALMQFPAKGYSMPEPYGVVLIISPWNYPVQLTLSPLVGALAAGNCAVIKPSEEAPHTSAALQELLSSCFSPEYVCLAPGGKEESAALLEQRFDYIFFTGGARVGRLVMQSAAQNLTPVTLELGGKSPCIVDRTADLTLAAKRIVFGKFLNAGQTCVAPDYLLVEKSIEKALLSEIKRAIRAFYGEDPLRNPDYPRIINQRHFDRLSSFLNGQTLFVGGTTDAAAFKIAPTLLTGVSPESPVMQEEIFGPLLPVLTWNTLDEAIRFVRNRPKPLALYLFSNQKETRRRILRTLSFGGGCVNDTILHITSPRLPFGGVGESGMGSYHGKASFDVFSHYKSILVKSNRFDLPARYPPYREKDLRLFRRIIK